MWIDLTDKYPPFSGIYQVKLDNNFVIKAYYHDDAMNWLNLFGQKTNHFQDHETLKFIDNVTHWFKKI
jgi:hypothetical protein